MSGDELYPNEQVAVVMYSPDFVTSAHDTGVKFMRAYLRAARFYNDTLVDGKIAGPAGAELIALLTQKTGLSDPAVLARMSAYGLDPNGELNIQGLRDDLDLYRQWGLIKGETSVEKVVDLSFAQTARASLPPYQRRVGAAAK